MAKLIQDDVRPGVPTHRVGGLCTAPLVRTRQVATRLAFAGRVAGAQASPWQQWSPR